MKGQYLVFLFFIFFISCHNNTDGNHFNNHHIQHKMNRPANSRLVESYDGTIIEVQDISMDSAKSLIANNKAIRLSESDDLGYDAFQLSDSNIVTVSRNYAGLYRSLDDLRKLAEDAKSDAEKQKFGPVSRHIFTNKNPFGKDFPKNTGQLINQLLKDLGIKEQSLNSGLLNQVDNAIASQEDPVKFEMLHYTNFVALIGEVLHQENDVQWQMKHDAESGIWEPRVNYKGKDWEFFTYLWEDIYQRQDADMPICSEIYQTAKDILKIKDGSLF